jgi:hypothetical protein
VRQSLSRGRPLQGIDGRAMADDRVKGHVSVRRPGALWCATTLTQETRSPLGPR